MGRSIQAFTAASLYAAIRIHNFPRLLEEMTEPSVNSLRAVHRSLGLIIRSVLPKLGLKYRPISPRPLVFRFGNELNLSISVQQAAADLLKKASVKGLAKMGKDPKGLAAAALYMCAKKSKERRTQTEIADISRITEVTLRTRAKQIKGCFKERAD
jgi:transcription initiation factor TFIIB